MEGIAFRKGKKSEQVLNPVLTIAGATALQSLLCRAPVLMIHMNETRFLIHNGSLDVKKPIWYVAEPVGCTTSPHLLCPLDFSLPS